MTTKVLNRTDWKSYFDRLASTLEGKLTSVEITSTRLSDQWAVRRLRLSGIAFDPIGDLIELDMRGVDHFIRHPQAVSVEERDGGVTSMEIVTDDDVREIVTFSDPLMLVTVAGSGPGTGTGAEQAHRLIFASRVVGTPVFSSNGNRIGKIEDLSIGRITGEVVYAVVSFGGFLGVGEKYHPLPWSILNYHPNLHGFVSPLDRTALEAAPSYDRNELVELGGASHISYGERIFGYYGRYGAVPYW